MPDHIEQKTEGFVAHVPIRALQPVEQQLAKARRILLYLTTFIGEATQCSEPPGFVLLEYLLLDRVEECMAQQAELLPLRGCTGNNQPKYSLPSGPEAAPGMA